MLTLLLVTGNLQWETLLWNAEVGFYMLQSQKPDFFHSH